MGHRHLFNSSQIMEADNDEGQNHSEHPYVRFARAGVSEGSNFVHPAQNTFIDSGNLALQLNHPPNTGGFLSGALTSEYPQYQPPLQPQPQLPWPTYDPFLHTSASGSNNMAQEDYASTSSSSIHGGQSRRGQYKRKHHGFPSAYQRDDTNRYWDTGSSSIASMSAESRQEKQVADSHHPSWDFSSCYGGHGVTFCNDDTTRNVRRRTSFGSEGNATRTHFSPDTTHNSMASVPIDRSSMPNLWGQAPNLLTREHNHGLINPAPHGSRPFVSEPIVFGPENPVIMENNNSSASIEMRGYHGQYSFHQNLVPRSVEVNPSQTIRGTRTTYNQRSATDVRASSSNLHPGNVDSSDEGFLLFSHGYAGRHSRSRPTSVLRHRSGRPRMSVDRFRARPDNAVVHNHLRPGGVMIVDHSAFHESENHFDQHRDMRLDIDNMTYEDLLALGERIGNVNTGVSEDLISKCLTESTFCSSDQPQEEGKCAICLEEYKDLDDVGTLKLCGHEFHVLCIRKWLAMKNNCPICKSCSLDDKMKNNSDAI